MNAMLKKLLIGVLLLALIALGGFFAHGRIAGGGQTQVASGATAAGADNAAPGVSVEYAGTSPPPPPGSAISIQPSGTSIAPLIGKSTQPPPDYIEYRNAKYGFSFYHTPQSSITVYDEGGGAATVVLENFQKMRGFQVFIVPYSEPKISEARFHEDVPSGVRQNVQNTTLDGVQAVTFNSQDQVLGQTREIWSINNGYLYEITTFSGVGQWFAPIIESWQFFKPTS